MNERQKVVAAAVSVLDIPLSVATLADRKALQKAMYLAQEVGVDLGYPYGWHQMGPYSSQLAEDYQEAAYAFESATGSVVRPLRLRYRKSLEALKPALDPPEDVKLTKTEWLELLASVHFLRKYVGQSEKEAHATLYRQKRALSKYMTFATATLTRAGLS